MTRAPKLSVGLPVYNGQTYLAESIEALLGQSYEDFELIISDNASTDDTADICHRYEKDDPRIRYFRQEHNIGGAPNHNFLVAQARGELFKWASHDDLYGRDLLKRCVDALEEFPHVILAHSWTALIDASGAITKAVRYGLATSSPSAPERFRSILYEVGGDDDGGVIRMDVLRRAPLLASYYHSDRTQVAGMALYGPFYHVPDWLYFRRDHDERAKWAFKTARSWCANLDPRRADALRNPALRLYAEYIWGYVSAIHGAPLSPADKREVLPAPGPLAVDQAQRAARAAHVRAAVRRRARFLAQGGHTRTGEEAAMSRYRLPGRAPGPGWDCSATWAGNIGNDASLEAMLKYLAADQPGAVLDAMCAGRQTVRDCYGVPAIALRWLPRGQRQAASANRGGGAQVRRQGGDTVA